ncbi:sensor histidine kinase [Tellurirhabdus bombi]|uniref:sensor histidine kinase n=1 Tax=Tellurirhabdus bombi TaxID=2907205 RepID=UPI001F39B8DA|nr:sensor histidine kinase [Tellurirhabdus bombi]
MKPIFRRLFLLLLSGCVLAAILLKVDSPLSISFRIQLIFLALGAGFIIYHSLSWSVLYIVNRSAEYLTPQQLVASTITSSVIIAAAVGATATSSLRWFWGIQSSLLDYVFNAGLLALITASVTGVYSLRLFVGRWKALTLMEEGLKQAVLKAEFDSLKNQVNPHFLFNSLNILSALIPEDTRNAVHFVERLSKVFRYSLQHSDQNTVDIATELRVAESYLFIHEMRFGDNFHYDICLSESEQSRQIITQGLLTLLENVVKHNEISGEKPLLIEIFAETDYLVVRNNYQPKNHLQVQSSGIGLKNLQNRYAQLNDKPVQVEKTEETYTVKLPLL